MSNTAMQTALQVAASSALRNKLLQKSAIAQVGTPALKVPAPQPMETAQALSRAGTRSPTPTTTTRQGLPGLGGRTGQNSILQNLASTWANVRPTIPRALARPGQINAANAGPGTAPVGANTAVNFAGNNLGEKAVNYANQFIGTPYVYGGSQPGGFDCSGLVQYVYGKLGVRLPRVASAQATSGTITTVANLRPGDLVAIENNSRQAGADHVGIYVGNGRYLNAPRTGANVRIDTVPKGSWGVKLNFF